ncbi:MAG: acyl-CoA dehydrogenase family protein [Phycisphaerales bacterium]|nr:acyl-CoA dehydrogenase family protein [Phycisphaerales bacterium]
MVGADERALVAAVRDFARAELPERDREWDRQERSCTEILPLLGGQGLMGLRVPEEFGGVGASVAAYAAIVRELAAASASVAVTVAVHNMVCEAIHTFASQTARERVLGELAAGSELAGFAISEPNAGSDTSRSQTQAQRVSGGFALTGSKMWVTNGVSGRWLIVLARLAGAHASSGGSKELTMFLLDAAGKGVSRSAIHGKMGIRGSETAELALDRAFVPEEHVLAGPGEGRRVALTALDGGRISIAAQAVGIADAALAEMLTYTQQREQFGRKIADFQAIQWAIADSATEIAASAGLIGQAAALKDRGAPFTRQAAMAKLYASEAANRIVFRAVQAHGGYGFVREFRVEQLYRDARITTLYEGTSEIQRVVIARELLRA